MKLLIHSQTSLIQPLQSGNGYFFPHFIMDELLIHAGIKVKTCQWKGSLNCLWTDEEIPNLDRNANHCMNILAKSICYYNDIIMSTMGSQITSLTIVYSTIYSRCRSKKTSKLRITGLCEGNSAVTSEFPIQRAINMENVSIWWCHHGRSNNPDQHIRYTFIFPICNFLHKRHLLIPLCSYKKAIINGIYLNKSANLLKAHIDSLHYFSVNKSSSVPLNQYM